MWKYRKWIAALLVSIMVFALAACGGKSSSSAGDDKSQFVTVTFVALGDKPKNGQFEKVMDKVNAIMKEKINANVQWKWVEWADWQTKYNLLLASGEPVDLVTIGTDWLDTWGNAQRGAFMPLDDLLPKYAPETWKSIPQEDWAQSKYNGKIVLIPENDYTQWINHGFFYRGDWAKQAGITEPIKDWDTIGKYLQWIKDNKPGVIPWDVQASDSIFGGWVQSHTQNLELPISTGYLPVFAGKSYDERYTVVSPVFDDTFLDFAKTMKQWADNGYWREDVLNNKNDTRTALQAGQTGMDQHHTQTFSGLRVQMDKKQPGSELQMFPFSRQSGNLLEMPITHGGVALGAHSKNPERALMAYDLMRNNKEIYQLLNYGIEGTQYVIKDGKRTLPDGYDETKDGFYSDFWAGRMDKFEIPSDTTWDKIDTLYSEYDKIKKPYLYGQFVFDNTNVQSELTAISQVTAEMGPAITYGKAGDPTQAVQDFRDKLKLAGYDKVMAELQRQLDAYKAQMDSSGAAK
ncbi:ABC transporter substrate-binding protein [Paenibacillus hunanensis]|uniref:Aldouronate transport system substrate-binding protein n=1 Tax=Paenibacillus hunanensis TaxID=539262 RepID=A0ABU1J0K4_9BACL|nr:extracellular solute-binding protein [Paenibacillus hunanensis]MDR6245008.1 putative aldouronate transport system substrate-binding protein [Paenibacillus hunanensis]GGI96010.1 putative ABC transporter substrate binding lipoprotein [Paenibacillus hunanensis]